MRGVLPIRVDFVPRPGARGRLGLTFAPGHRDPWFLDAHARDLDADLRELRDTHGCQVLVGLVQAHELQALDIEALPVRAGEHGLTWLHTPIPDGGAPQQADLVTLVAAIREALDRDRTVVVHCRAGLGRSGLVAAAVLVAEGAEPGDAQSRVRAARPGAIETAAQERMLRTFAARWRSH